MTQALDPTVVPMDEQLGGPTLNGKDLEVVPRAIQRWVLVEDMKAVAAGPLAVDRLDRAKEPHHPTTVEQPDPVR
jgi:hypothetical protein